MEHAPDAPERLPDVARRPAQRREPECRDSGIQRVRDVPRRPCQLVHECARVDDVGRSHGCRRSDLLAFRRRACCDLGAGRVRRVRRKRALAREHADPCPDARRRRALSRYRHAARGPRRAFRRLPASHYPCAGRDADRAGIRVPDADRDPVLGRSGRSGDHHDDLRDPASDPDNSARHPRRSREHDRGCGSDGLDLAAGARQGAVAARAADAAPVREPDNSLRAFDGRDRGVDRRQGPG